jgi:hypothetical protein
MDSQITNDAQGIARTVPALNDIGERWHKIGEQLKAMADAKGTCWGEDQIGKQFASQYLNVHQQLLDALLNNGILGFASAEQSQNTASRINATEDQAGQTASMATPQE